MKQTNICYAKTYVHKALLGLMVFPAILVLGYIGLSRGGASYLDVPYLIYSGQLSWWKQTVGWTCIVIGVLRYCPASLRALRYGLCVVGRQGDELVLSNIRLPISEVQSVRPVSNITKKGIIIETNDSQLHYACSILTDFNNPSKLAKRIRADCNLKED